LRGGGAILKANNSLMDSARLVRIPGAEVRQDGDVLRIELPSDQLFHPGTSQLQPAGLNLLDQAADSLTRAFPRQLIGIEGHTDRGTDTSASPHQLTSAQAVAVVDVLTRRNRLPANQLFTVGQGTNHPLASNATTAGRAKNRRIELVVYPETVE
jgi:chemotaxis protein MotB